MDILKIEKMKLDPKILTRMGRKGKALIVIQSALELSAMNNFEGTKIKEMKKPRAFIDSKAWKGTANGDGGAYWQLDNNSERFNTLYELCKPAQESINRLIYDDPVKNLINAFYDIPHLRGKKGKILQKDSLARLTL